MSAPRGSAELVACSFSSCDWDEPAGARASALAVPVRVRAAVSRAAAAAASAVVGGGPRSEAVSAYVPTPKVGVGAAPAVDTPAG